MTIGDLIAKLINEFDLSTPVAVVQVKDAESTELAISGVESVRNGATPAAAIVVEV